MNFIGSECLQQYIVRPSALLLFVEIHSHVTKALYSLPFTYIYSDYIETEHVHIVYKIENRPLQEAK